jgi:predicted DNA-binding protein (UPF0251 family)
MPRPKCCRTIHGVPLCSIFKPAGIPVSTLEEVVLAMDEFEAVRLADQEGLYHEEAARRMNISRQTFGRTLEAARHKIARVLTEGLALRIEGGHVAKALQHTFQCRQCLHVWVTPCGSMGKPVECPACKGRDMVPLSEGCSKQ